MFKYPAVVLSTAALAHAVGACGSSSTRSTNSNAPFATTSASTAAAATTSAASSAATSSAATSAAGAAGGSNNLAIAANSSGLLKFSATTLTAKAGKVTIAFTNNSPLQHNFTLQEGTSGKVLDATPTFQGGTKTLTLSLKPGTYTFYCSVPGHRMAGMQGTLTVS
jgi:plastocyanin